MARRRSDGVLTILWDLFMVAPWWVCPVSAAVVYAGLAYLTPALFASNQNFKPLAVLFQASAPYAAALILAVGGAAGLRRWAGGALLDRQTGADTISALTWQEFEELLAAAYRRQGYRVVETGGGGADGGVDLVLHGKGETVLVQCKQWRAYKVGVQVVRELHGILSSRGTNADRAIFVTFGEYTKEARQFAEENSIEIVGRDRLLKMIAAARKDSSAKADASQASEPAQRIESAPTVQETAPPSCPKCGKPMVLRTARKGANAGSQFWGCTGYPECRGTVARQADGVPV